MPIFHFAEPIVLYSNSLFSLTDNMTKGKHRNHTFERLEAVFSVNLQIYLVINCHCIVSLPSHLALELRCQCKLN